MLTILLAGIGAIVPLIITLIIIGIIWWLLEKYVPLPAFIWTVIRIIIVLAVIIWLLDIFGIYSLPLRIR